MAKGEKVVPALTRAADALESELANLERLSRSVRKLRLDSDRNIARAATELNEALALPGRLAAGLGTLAAAMQEMQERQQAALEPLTACATAIQERSRLLGEHMQEYAELGEAAAETTALLQSGDASTVLDDVTVRLGDIVERAKALFEKARTDDFPDVAREADALRQRIASVRRRLLETKA
ncbi:MAG TPA: hypothetical protein VH062_20475 [Polyangiaceae bacterium]|jgi:response regulator RpfG family c-di-GMP phosphodiesterase|nr:hypothetical protein [Polyangiaceae bacterium]